MAQNIINIGATANDGTGDPLRTAFNEVNLNFNQVFAAGPVLSNIQIANNTILTTNTNGNLVLSPNGIGVVQANVNILPNTSNIRNLGSNTQRWATVYAQYLNVSADTTFSSDVTINGNLTVNGNIIEVGNIITDALTIQLANTAITDAAANSAGITVGASDNIATFLYNSTTDAWRTNIGLSVAGNLFVAGTITGNVPAAGANGQLQFNNNGTLGAASFGLNYDNSVGTFYVTTGSFSGNTVTGSNGLYAGFPSFTVLGSAVMGQFTGNVADYSQLNFQNTSNSNVASGDYIITADNGTDTTHFVDLGITSSTWDGTQLNSLGNRLGANDGYLYVQNGDFVLGTSNGNIETWKFDQTGNLTTPGDIIITGNIISTQSSGVTVGSNFDVFIVADRTDNNHTWKFDGSAGETQIPGDLITVGSVITVPFPLSSLTPADGARAFVSDGNLVAAGNFGAQIGGGGANTVPVWSDGTNWYIG